MRQADVSASSAGQATQIVSIPLELSIPVSFMISDFTVYVKNLVSFTEMA